MHTIAIDFDPDLGLFCLHEIRDDNNCGSMIFAHKHFMDAQQHALMLLSETGDFRFTTRQIEPPHTHSHEEPFSPHHGSALDPSAESDDA